MSDIQKLLRYVRDSQMEDEQKDELLLMIVEYYYKTKEREE